MGLLDFLKKHKKQKSYKICCDRCKRELLEDEAEQIGNHRVCRNCALPSSAPVSSDQVPQWEMDTRPAAHLSARAEELELLFCGKNQSSFKFTFHILANGGLAWKYRLFRRFRFGRYLAYHSTTQQVFSFKSSTGVVNRPLITMRPCLRLLAVPPVESPCDFFQCAPSQPWLSCRLHGHNSSASW